MKDRKQAHLFGASNAERRTLNGERQTANGKAGSRKEARTFQMIIPWPILEGFGKSGYGVKAKKEKNIWELFLNL